MNKITDVLCVGIAVADVMGKSIDSVPDWDRLGTFDHVEHHVGGCAVNTGMDLARLGARTSLAACIGSDGAGAFVRASLESSGIDVANLVVDPECATSYTFVMISSTGRRRYLHHVGANARFDDAHVTDEALSAARIMHVGGTFLMPGLDGMPTARLLERARKAGVITSMDTAFNPSVDCAALLAPCLPLLDIFIPSVEEAQAITGEETPEAILGALRAACPGIVGVKLGREGCVVARGDETVKLEAFDVPVVDASGAGDAFMAGFLYALLQERELADCARFASATAAHCIQAIGCSAGVPAACVVEAFLADQ